MRCRAEFYYQRFDALRSLRHEVRRELLRRSAEARRLEIVTRDSVHRPDPGGSAVRLDANTASFSHQAAALDLERIWDRDAQQCRTAIRSGRAAAREKAGLDSRAESQSQSRTEERIQKCRHRGRCEGWPV